MIVKIHTFKGGYRMALETIHIYHTNDIHSHLEHWPKIAHFIKQQRKKHTLQGEEMLLFDIGDHCDRFDSLTEGLDGKGNVKLLNALDYHNTTIGNNEGITFSKANLDSLYDEANFQVLVANLFHQNGETPNWTKAYDIHTLGSGTKVGVIGITIPFYAFYELLGWQVVDPWEILPPLVRKVREKADIVILLSHMGFGFDLQIAEQIEGIDVILGGHTHHVLQQGKLVKGTLIAQAGRFGHYAGQITLTYDSNLNQLVSADASCVSIASGKEDDETSELIQNLRKEAEHHLNERVTVLEEPLPVSWYEQSQFTELLAEGLREWCGTQVSMVNAGILLEGLPQGAVTKSDLHRVCPHPINPCVVNLTGRELKEIIAQGLSSRMVELRMKGFGFRGKVMGAMIYDGIQFEVEQLSDGQNRARDIVVAGRPLDVEAMYRVATIDMFTFGRLYPAIAQAKEKNYYLPEMLRDLLAWKLRHSRTQ